MTELEPAVAGTPHPRPLGKDLPRQPSVLSLTSLDENLAPNSAHVTRNAKPDEPPPLLAEVTRPFVLVNGGGSTLTPASRCRCALAQVVSRSELLPSARTLPTP